MRYDITPSDKGEVALSICFTCDVIGHMIVLTNQNRLLKYSAVAGQLLAEVDIVLFLVIIMISILFLRYIHYTTQDVVLSQLVIMDDTL